MKEAEKSLKVLPAGYNTVGFQYRGYDIHLKPYKQSVVQNEKSEKTGKIIEFADALATYGYLYISNGKDPNSYNFAPELGITTLEEYYNWLPEIKRDSKGNPTIFTKLP